MSLFPNFERWRRELRAAVDAWKQQQKATQPDRNINMGGAGRPGGSAKDNLVNEILNRLGPLGKLVGGLLGGEKDKLSQEIKRELEAAERLVESAEQNKGGSVEPPSHREADRDVRLGAQEPQPDAEAGPLIEGPILVRSSNVYSISYVWGAHGEDGNMRVRFLGGDSKQRVGPGPEYEYTGVPRAVFVAFKLASSKGKEVWNQLRVRGSISGHQFPYHLVSTGDSDYVPRQAGLKRGMAGEYYLQRSFQGRKSSLPERKIGSGRGRKPVPLERDFRKNAQSKIKLRAGQRGLK